MRNLMLLLCCLMWTLAKAQQNKPGRDTIFNDYNAREIGQYAGMHTVTAKFNYLQLAQQFNIPKAGIKLKELTIHRYTVDWEQGERIKKDFMPVIFGVRIYDMDLETKGPGKDLCDSLITVENLKRSTFDIDLKKYNITVPGKTFFIAVEWLFDQTNMGYAMLHDVKTGRIDSLASYRPYIAISPKTGSTLNIWGKNLEGEWKPYNYFSPFGTDLAIKVKAEN